MFDLEARLVHTAVTIRSAPKDLLNAMIPSTTRIGPQYCIGMKNRA